MKQKVIWSLFDGSGLAGEEAANMGHKVICFNFDGGDHGDYAKFNARVMHDNIDYINVFIDSKFQHEAISGKFGIPDFIMAFPPCTDLAVSGAAHFERKRKADPDFQIKAVETAKIAANIGDALGVPYIIENPVSVLASMWRKPDFIFNPWEYGGYLPDGDCHPWFPEFIAPRDAYPKKTCLWTSPGLTIPDRNPVKRPDGFSNQHKKLGGKSAKTKLIRSLSPRGFFKALANSIFF